MGGKLSLGIALGLGLGPGLGLSLWFAQMDARPAIEPQTRGAPQTGLFLRECLR